MRIIIVVIVVVVVIIIIIIIITMFKRMFICIYHSIYTILFVWWTAISLRAHGNPTAL